jgi:uncharacterized protein (DUF1330 family)
LGLTIHAIAQVAMTDRAAHDRHQARFVDVLRKFDGRLLSADERSVALEGVWEGATVRLRGRVT